MWDSARKPIKIRSVLQRNGMRHFIVNEESDEIYSSFVQRRNGRTNTRPPADGSDNLGQHQPSNFNERYRHCASDFSDNNAIVKSKEKGTSCSLSRSLTLNESHDDRRASECNGDDFFGVAGSKICNSKKHKGHLTSRYFHQYPHSLKENALLQLSKEMEIGRCSHSKADLLNLVPVKSPVIKKLISGGASASANGSNDLLQKQKGSNSKQDGAPSTSLCSRIMTWIDLEVKRNAGKGKPASSSLPFTSADLNIVNGLTLPYDSCPSTTSISSASSDNDTSSSASGESNVNSSSNSSCSSSAVSLPKLVPCWRKDVHVADGVVTSRAKKSVRIADDLPRWGKMKPRLRKKDRSMSVDELLYDDEQASYSLISADHKKFAGQNMSRGRELPRHASTVELSERCSQSDEGLWSNEGNYCEDKKEKETDSFVVCDQRLLASGRVQVHIFLPQTDSARECGATCNVSARSEDSTS